MVAIKCVIWWFKAYFFKFPISCVILAFRLSLFQHFQNRYLMPESFTNSRKLVFCKTCKSNYCKITLHANGRNIIGGQKTSFQNSPHLVLLAFERKELIWLEQLQQTSLACMFYFLNRSHVIILLRAVSSKFRLIHEHINCNLQKGEVSLDFKLLKRARQAELWLE